jgi:hypothetical protein
MEGYIHAIGLPSLLQKRVTLRETEITMTKARRKVTLPAGTRVGLVTVPTSAARVRVRVLEGAEDGNAGEIDSADLAQQ